MTQNKDGLVKVIKAQENNFVQTLNKVYTEEIIPYTTELAKDDAAKNLPSSDTETSIHTDFLTSRFNTLVVEHRSKTETEEQYHANKQISEFKKLKKRLTEKLNETVNTIRIKKRALENLKSCKQKILDYRKALFGIVLLTVSEAIFSSTSFQIFVSNMLFSLIIGATFAVALYFSAVVGAKILKLTTSRQHFMLAFLGILTVIGIVFYTLGYFRILFLKEMTEGTETSYELSPLQFMLIQIFFFACAILLKYFYYPEKSEWEQYRTWKKEHAELDKLDSKREHFEQSIKEMEQSLDQTLVTRRTLIAHSRDTELKIDALYKDAYQHYVKTNIHHRTDNEIPLCFQVKDNISELTLFFQDPALLEFNDADLDDE